MVLVGPAGSGKSTFARRNFADSEVLSSDMFRKFVADDEADQTATPQAFAVLRFIAPRRLRRRRLTVIDATNVRRRDRLSLLRLAQRFGRPAVALLFDLPLALCLIRNRERTGRQVDERVVRRQWEEMPHAPSDLVAEGFQGVFAFTAPGDVDSAIVLRE